MVAKIKKEDVRKKSARVQVGELSEPVAGKKLTEKEMKKVRGGLVKDLKLLSRTHKHKIDW